MRPCFYEIEENGTVYDEPLEGIAFLKYDSALSVGASVKLRRVATMRDPCLDGVDEWRGSWVHIGLPRIESPETCPHYQEAEVPRRPGNALNIEVGTPSPRCLMRPPGGHREGRSSLRWLLSGGCVLAYGYCCAECPPEAMVGMAERKKPMPEDYCRKCGLDRVGLCHEEKNCPKKERAGP